MIHLSIIIVSFNTEDFLQQCIESIAKTIPKDITYEVIVVDNNSTDGTKETIPNLKSQISNLKCIWNNNNVGFSTANNQGVKESKGTYVLFLNPDTMVKENTIKTMIDFMDREKAAGAATCKVHLQDGSIDDASHRGFPTPWRAFSHFSGLAKVFSKTKLFSGYSMGWKNLSEVHEIDALAGAFMIVRREAGEAVSWWDEDFFWYGEDIDFCYRLKEKGWKIFYVPSAEVLHYKGVSGGIKEHSQHLSKATTETKVRATKARYDAMRLFYKKHYESVYPKILSRVVLFAIEQKQKSALAKLT